MLIYNENRHNMNMGENSSGRIISLDALRGFTIAAMILVNFPGNGKHVFPPLEHAHWNGWTPTDLIFPFFLFIVGVSIVLSLTKRKQQAISMTPLHRKIIWRAVKIFVVGLLLNALGLIPEFHLSELRVTGVLQRIAIVYLICSFLFLHVSIRWQVIIGAVILVIYLIVMMFVPVPGVGIPMLEPGVNLAAWVDNHLLPGAMWQGTWDPEGILSTFPAIATGLTGVFAGILLKSGQTQERKIILLFSAGFCALILGRIWGWFFPINKNLWTSSFVLFTSGLAAMTLAVTMFILDLLGYVRFTKPWIIFGSNAITVYVLAGILSPFFYDLKVKGDSLNMHFFRLFTEVGLPPQLVSALYAFLYVWIIFIPAWLLYRKKIFIKL